MIISAIACGILGAIAAYAIHKWRAESKLVGELRSDIDYLYGIIDNMQYDLDIERDKTVTREHIINNRDAEIKDLQDRLEDAQRQIADCGGKAEKPKPLLADAEVGDEVELRNGNIELIRDTHNR